MRAVVVVLSIFAASAAGSPVASSQEAKPPSEWIRQMKYGRTPEERLAAIRERKVGWCWYAVIDAIRDPDPAVRKSVLRFFHVWPWWGSELGTLISLEAAHDSQPGFRLAALKHLGLDSGASPVAPLLARVGSAEVASERDAVRAALKECVSSYRARDDHVASEFLRALTNGSDSVAQRRAVRALLDWADSTRPGLPLLVERLGDPHPWVRREATRFVENAVECGCRPGHFSLRPEHLRAVVARLSDEDTDVRNAALGALQRVHGEQLGWVPVEAAVRGLIPILHDSNARVRAVAAATLGRLGRGGKGVEPLRRSLTDPSPVVRRSAVAALAEHCPNRAEVVQEILPLLDDHDRTVRDAAFEALGRFGRLARVVGPKLVAMLEDPAQREANGSEALVALAEVGLPDPAALEVVCSLLRHETLDLDARRAVAGLGPEQAWAVPRLVVLLQDPDSSNSVREAVLSALARIGIRARPGLPYVSRLLCSEESHVRLRALVTARAIAGLDRPSVPEVIALLGESIHDVTDYWAESAPWSEVLPDLIDALDDPRTKVRAWAAQRIERFGGGIDAAVPGLVRRLADREERVVSWAASALRRDRSHASLTVPALVRALERARQRETRKTILDTLEAIGPEARLAAPALIVRLDDPELRWSAFCALKAIGSGALDALRTVKDSTSEPSREKVTTLLGEIGELALPDLLESLGDPHPSIRELAARWIGESGPCATGSEARLLALIGDEYAFVRLAAVKALGRIAPDPETTIEALVRATRDDYGFVRFEAVRSIRALGPDAAPATPRLVEILETDWEHIRFEAARALGAIGRDAASALPVLERVQREGSPAVRLAAERALSAVHP